MQIYLPIAEISVNIFLLLGLGGGIGVLSGLFGVGGGFLLTPLLIVIGIPPSVAVATGANQIVASSVAGVLSHWRRGNVDVKMGILLLLGGLAGSSIGVGLFSLLRRLGQIDLFVALAYVLLLGAIGGLMFVEGWQSLNRSKRAAAPRRKMHQHTWMHGLPLKMRFRKSRLYISALLPLLIGFVVGVLSAMMGVGGGFVVVPAMIYLLGMPTLVVVGTSLFQIIFVTANATILQSSVNHSVDIVLALLLIVGGVIGAPIGARLGSRLPAEKIRILLALMVLGVCVWILIGLFIPPGDVYAVQLTRSG
ncbi:TSUP family transporter [Alphaproteobacteria bacterium HT1-32]|nr:TSUP family transporter [Alphaproteobacteria bacterium HT1-32]